MRQLAVKIEGPNHYLYIYDFARDALADDLNSAEARPLHLGSHLWQAKPFASAQGRQHKLKRRPYNGGASCAMRIRVGVFLDRAMSGAI